MARPATKIQFITGQKIDFLTVTAGPIIEALENRTRIYWDCVCICGNAIKVRGDNLGTRTHSCGCKQHVPKDLETRFKSHIDIEDSGCWAWIGARSNKGAGVFTLTSSPLKLVQADRAAMLIKNVPIARTQKILRVCLNQGCVNPDHLYVKV